MKYNCIRCGSTWGQWEKNEDERFYSSGLCKECAKIVLIPKVRMNQKKEGYWDCFGTVYGGKCDQEKCKYLDVCTNLHT
jgi:DNA-directed RNA polymerase subunit RPC12/RpoP